MRWVLSKCGTYEISSAGLVRRAINAPGNPAGKHLSPWVGRPDVPPAYYVRLNGKKTRRQVASLVKEYFGKDINFSQKWAEAIRKHTAIVNMSNFNHSSKVQDSATLDKRPWNLSYDPYPTILTPGMDLPGNHAQFSPLG